MLAGTQLHLCPQNHVKVWLDTMLLKKNYAFFLGFEWNFPSSPNQSKLPWGIGQFEVLAP